MLVLLQHLGALALDLGQQRVVCEIFRVSRTRQAERRMTRACPDRERQQAFSRRGDAGKTPGVLLGRTEWAGLWASVDVWVRTVTLPDQHRLVVLTYKVNMPSCHVARIKRRACPDFSITGGRLSAELPRGSTLGACKSNDRRSFRLDQVPFRPPNRALKAYRYDSQTSSSGTLPPYPVVNRHQKQKLVENALSFGVDRKTDASYIRDSATTRIQLCPVDARRGGFVVAKEISAQHVSHGVRRLDFSSWRQTFRRVAERLDTLGRARATTGGVRSWTSWLCRPPGPALNAYPSDLQTSSSGTLPPYHVMNRHQKQKLGENALSFGVNRKASASYIRDTTTTRIERCG